MFGTTGMVGILKRGGKKEQGRKSSLPVPSGVRPTVSFADSSATAAAATVASFAGAATTAATAIADNYDYDYDYDDGDNLAMEYGYGYGYDDEDDDDDDDDEPSLGSLSFNPFTSSEIAARSAHAPVATTAMVVDSDGPYCWPLLPPSPSSSVFLAKGIHRKRRAKQERTLVFVYQKAAAAAATAAVAVAAAATTAAAAAAAAAKAAKAAKAAAAAAAAKAAVVFSLHFIFAYSRFSRFSSSSSSSSSSRLGNESGTAKPRTGRVLHSSPVP